MEQWQDTHIPPWGPEFKFKPDLKTESGELLAIGQQFTVKNLTKCMYWFPLHALLTTCNNITDKALGMT